MKAECEKETEKTPDFMKVAEEYLAKNRRLFLWGAVDDESAEQLVKRLLYLDSLNHEDITLFINSPGGVISSGLAIYDCMNAIRAMLSQCAADKRLLWVGPSDCRNQGKRYAWPNARILIHQPLIQGEMVGPASDIKIQQRKCCVSVVLQEKFLPIKAVNLWSKLNAIRTR
jgi:ATP-dependent Clp protease protease subunit